MAGKRTLVGILSAILLITSANPVMAGGYAVVRLDEEPGEMRVAMPWRFGFMVLQHDITPNSDVTPVVRAQHRETGEKITATAIQEGPVGHFVAEMTFPRAGEWKWSIEPRPYGETSFATLLVLETPRLHVWPASPWTRLWRNPTQISAMQPVSQTDAGDKQTVEMLDSMMFAPSSMHVLVGTVVTWVNRSEATHTVTGDDLAFDDSGPLAPGQSFATTFDVPGTYRYHCGPHPGMVGEITVT
jgi:plastocyanin